MGRIECIFVFAQKKGPKRSVLSAEVLTKGGIVGDFHAEDGKRAISLMDWETVKTLEVTSEKGLCGSKFAANIVTSGISYETLAVGEWLRRGETVLEVGQVGKECWAACEIDDPSLCPLKGACAFATSQREGVIRVGDSIEVGDDAGI